MFKERIHNNGRAQAMIGLIRENTRYALWMDAANSWNEAVEFCRLTKEENVHQQYERIMAPRKSQIFEVAHAAHAVTSTELNQWERTILVEFVVKGIPMVEPKKSIKDFYIDILNDRLELEEQRVNQELAKLVDLTDGPA